MDPLPGPVSPGERFLADWSVAEGAFLVVVRRRAVVIIALSNESLDTYIYNCKQTARPISFMTWIEINSSRHGPGATLSQPEPLRPSRDKAPLRPHYEKKAFIHEYDTSRLSYKRFRSRERPTSPSYASLPVMSSRLSATFDYEVSGRADLASIGGCADIPADLSG